MNFPKDAARCGDGDSDGEGDAEGHVLSHDQAEWKQANPGDLKTPPGMGPHHGFFSAQGEICLGGGGVLFPGL